MGAWVDRRASATTLGSSPAASAVDAPVIDTNSTQLTREDSPARSATSYRSVPLLKCLVFCGGFTSIGVELTASRLLAPYFGSSTFIWASLIGLTLTFLALGYYLGGRLADRRPDPRLLYLLAVVAAVAIATIPIVARPLLSESLDAFRQLDAGAFYGSLVGTLLLLAPPITLLGFISPYAVRLQLTSVADAGQTAGSLYALSTVGSIAGSFVPVLLLIPLIGTATTFVALALALLIPALAGLIALRARGIGLVAALVALLLPALAMAAPAGIRPPERGVLVHEQESAYNYIQVVDEDGQRALILNDGHAVHSLYDPQRLLSGGPWDYFMVAPLLVEDRAAAAPTNALLIGLAGGTVARQLTAAFGPIPITGVEIDPEIAAIGREYFGLDELPNVDVVVADGRYALKTLDQSFDLIGVDAYRQPYIPFQLTSREFFLEVSDHLSPDGVAVVNAGRTATDYRLVDALAATMRDVFPYVMAIDVAQYNNTILVGSNVPLSADSLSVRAGKLPATSPVREVAEWSLNAGNIRSVAFDPNALVFTDDKAPVEMVIDQMIFDAARQLTGQ